MSEDALDHIEELPFITLEADLPESDGDAVYFVYLSGDKLYTA
jgi:hypothetical protein